MDTPQYLELVAITDGIVAEARAASDPILSARPAAFKEACRRRPDLAATAHYPSGAPVMPSRAAKAAGGGIRAAGDFNARVAAAAQSPLAKACEKLAG